MKLSQVKKVLPKATLKAIFTKSLLPQIFLVGSIVILHWIFLGTWIYNNFDSADKTKLAVMCIVGGVLPVLVYGIWGFRRFVMKSYLIIHETILKIWIEEYTDQLASNVVERDLMTQLDQQDGKVFKFRTYILDKAENLPSIIKRLIKWLLKKVNIAEEINQKAQLLKRNDKSEISEKLNVFISEKLIDISGNLVPGWVTILVPIHIILLAVAWFY